MSLRKEAVWADLRYALDELERQPREKNSRFSSLLDYPNAADLDAQSDDEFHERLSQLGVPTLEYSRAIARADTKIAHEAIEKGLKTILLDAGMPEKGVRACSHHLDRLLAGVQQYNSTAFNELERIFESTLSYLESVTSRTLVATYRTCIIDYFQKHGKEKVFVANRYASIEGEKNEYGMIGQVYREVIRALLSLIFGWTPVDICSLIEEEARKAILAESKLDPAWDAAEWLSQGPIRPRLEVIENLEHNRVLYAAVRRCAKESKDSRIQYWAERLRRNRIAARRQPRAEHRVG